METESLVKKNEASAMHMHTSQDEEVTATTGLNLLLWLGIALVAVLIIYNVKNLGQINGGYSC